MAKPVDRGAARRALRSRLRVVADELIPGARDDDDAALLARLAEFARDRGHPEQWLLLVALSGSLPTADEVRVFGRSLRSIGRVSPLVAALEGALGPAGRSNYKASTIELVGGTVVDVDFCARHGHNTGIQRVTRAIASRWAADPDVSLVAWTADGTVTRRLSPAEYERVVRWTSDRRVERSGVADDDQPLLVPWDATVVLPEVAASRICDRMAALAEFSSNRVVMVGHDLIPITSAVDVTPEETERFVRYLGIVKHASAIASVSESAAEEFRGFGDAAANQGLPRPEVRVVPLPFDVVGDTGDTEKVVAPGSGGPLVVSVGSQENRKNQTALLAAAEALWRDGLAFRLVFMGGHAGILSAEFDDDVDRLQRAGRPVRVVRNPGDDELRSAYQDARFSAMVSIHEGFGLPVAESLSAGTPVLTSSHGSLAEIARSGGCVTVDARDDRAIAEGMRRLLLDDGLHDRLVAEIARIPRRTWGDYADDLRAFVRNSAR